MVDGEAPVENDKNNSTIRLAAPVDSKAVLYANIDATVIYIRLSMADVALFIDIAFDSIMAATPIKAAAAISTIPEAANNIN